ncbi:MAG: multiple sugar transport system substrate-binding protein [Frankiales bacterium]|nr:multiple sugar transport system substrate-binding protein [Frankiales bacterium]
MSRNRLVAAAIIPILALTGCNSTPASPTPSSPAASSVATTAPTSSTGPAPSASVAEATPGTKFAGISVNILTFNGPQIAEPLQRRAPDWEKLTGGHVNVVAVGFQTIYDKALLDASTGTNSFDGYVFDPQWMGDFVGPGYLLDLTAREKADTQLDQQDIVPFFRDYNSVYDGKNYTIPLDGDFHMVYYRSDLLAKDGLKPPATWDDYLTIAAKYNGQDLNGDSQPDYGSCIAKKKGAQSYWWIISLAAGLLQSKGTGQGAFFDTTTMAPLFGPNEAMTLALQTYAKTRDLGPPDELNMDVGGSRGLFTTGRCALTMDWGDIGTLTPGTYAQDKTGATITPGWKQVLDRATGKLVPCDATTCPNAVDGVNYAPFGSFGGWSGAINAKAPAAQQDAAYDFISYMSAPAQSSIDVTLGKTGYNPYRTSHFSNSAPWLAAGLSQAATDNYLGAIKTSLDNKNFVLDLRIPLTKQYEQDVLDTAIAQYLAKELDETATEQAIADGWNAITDQAGKDKQLAAYVASLGIK